MLVEETKKKQKKTKTVLHFTKKTQATLCSSCSFLPTSPFPCFSKIKTFTLRQQESPALPWTMDSFILFLVTYLTNFKYKIPLRKKQQWLYLHDFTIQFSEPLIFLACSSSFPVHTCNGSSTQINFSISSVFFSLVDELSVSLLGKQRTRKQPLFSPFFYSCSPAKLAIYRLIRQLPLYSTTLDFLLNFQV